MVSKKIIFFDFANFNYVGGAEKNFMKLGKWFSKKGYSVGFISGSFKLNKLSTKFGAQLYDKKLSDKQLKNKFGVENYLKYDFIDLFLPTKNRKKLKEQLKKSNMIISKNEIIELLALKLFFNVDPSKITFGFHTPLYYPITRDLKSKLHNYFYNSIIYIKLLGKSKVRCLVLTDMEKSSLQNKGVKDIAVIPNPLDTKKFYQKDYVKNRKFKVYFIGRMTEQKGIDIIYYTIINLSKKKEFDNIEFYFVGSGEQDYYLKDLIKKFKNCHFLGFHSEVVKFYHDADLVIVPSRWESYCYSVAEAQSCGVPVVSSNIPGPNGLIINNKTGLLIKPNDPVELEKGILNLYLLWKTNFNNFKKMGIGARKHIVENFEEDMINKKIEKFIFRK